MATLFLFGNQVFHPSRLKALDDRFDGRIERVIMLESRRMSTTYRFHKYKIAFLWTAMRDYADELRQAGFAVEYHAVDAGQELKDIWPDTGEVWTFQPADRGPRRTLQALSDRHGVTLRVAPTPMFLTTPDDFARWREEARQHKRMFFASFYAWQRQRLGLLLDQDGGPLGGQWSFDEQNRKRLPRDVMPPKLPDVSRSTHWADVTTAVRRYFPDHPGSLEHPWLPTDRRGAHAWLQTFLHERLDNFGPYEDSLADSSDAVFHSALSPLLNVGLLTPDEVVDALVAHHTEHDPPIASVEGFLRQVIGWREYMFNVYETMAHDDTVPNFWGHHKTLPDSFYTGTTGIVPVDDVIRKVNRLAWSHHIERLMVMGNWMLLNEYAPEETCRWFMDMYVDAYEWVMMPNVYAMSQFADGGKVMTKPYISASHYLLKMSRYKKGEWSKAWDDKFWSFLIKHEAYFRKNPRMNMLLKRHAASKNF